MVGEVGQGLIERLVRGTGSVLLGVLNAVAESDRRYQEEMRMRGVSESFLKDAGLTRRQLETAYQWETPFPLKLRKGAATTPAE